MQYNEAFDLLAFEGAKEKLHKDLGYPANVLDFEYRWEKQRVLGSHPVINTFIKSVDRNLNSDLNWNKKYKWISDHFILRGNLLTFWI